GFTRQEQGTIQSLAALRYREGGEPPRVRDRRLGLRQSLILGRQLLFVLRKLLALPRRDLFHLGAAFALLRRGRLGVGPPALSVCPEADRGGDQGEEEGGSGRDEEAPAERPLAEGRRLGVALASFGLLGTPSLGLGHAALLRLVGLFLLLVL